MKKAFFPWLSLGIISLLIDPAFQSAAQATGGDSPIPVVTIRATDPIGLESGKAATFQVMRQGSTNETLLVYYLISGTASNGVDYVALSQWATVPAGITSVPISVQPIPDSSAETNEEQAKTVVLQLSPSPLMIPVNFSIGYPSNAVVYILDDDHGTNIPPVINLVTPSDGAVFSAPVGITLVADAFDFDGAVSSVEFFAGTTSLGVVSNGVVIDPLPGGSVIPGTRAFILNWDDVPPGGYTLTAVATDNGGDSSASDPVKITILPGPPPTNIPPAVRIVSPANHSVFRSPLDIPLYAYANDPDGYVTSVEFFAGATSLGFGRSISLPAPQIICGDCPLPIFPTNQYFLVWSNAPAGVYDLTAAATDNGGASTVSAPVNVAILPSVPPPTNRPPIVSIVATDPIAIEGTNCWEWWGLTNAAPNWASWLVAVRFPFISCGPKDALFTVCRLGETNDAVTVNYSIGGSASNGVDYVALPGSVTISVGQHLALIPIVPIDDGPPDVTKTVILNLTPSPGLPPEYKLGYPKHAAAIIVDSNRPRPATAVLPDRCFHLNATGPDGAWFRLDYSTNLLNWTSLCTNQVIAGSIDFVDPDAPGDSVRFYRAVPDPDYSPQ